MEILLQTQCVSWPGSQKRQFARSPYPRIPTGTCTCSRRRRRTASRAATSSRPAPREKIKQNKSRTEQLCIVLSSTRSVCWCIPNSEISFTFPDIFSFYVTFPILRRAGGIQHNSSTFSNNLNSISTSSIIHVLLMKSKRISSRAKWYVYD